MKKHSAILILIFFSTLITRGCEYLPLNLTGLKLYFQHKRNVYQVNTRNKTIQLQIPSSNIFPLSIRYRSINDGSFHNKIYNLSCLKHISPENEGGTTWGSRISGFLIGGLFGRYVLVLIGSFVLCVMSKSFMPLLYSLFIICSAIASLHDAGWSNPHLMEVFPFFKYDWSFLLFIGYISYYLVVRFFIGSSDVPAKTDKYFLKHFMVIITVFNLAAVFFFFINARAYKFIFAVTLFVDAALGLLLVFKLFRTADKGLKLILTGVLIMICSGIIRLILDLFELFPYFYLYSSGIVLETMFFILAFNYKKSQHELSLALVKNELDFRQREITQKTMYITQQGEILDKIKCSLEAIDCESSQNKQLISNLISDVLFYTNQNSWDEFERYFIEVHPDFFTRLKQLCPDLTSNELRLCAMLRLALSTKEIATISGKTPKSIDVMRNRIRSKMRLDRQDRLYDTLSVL